MSSRHCRPARQLWTLKRARRMWEVERWLLLAAFTLAVLALLLSFTSAVATELCPRTHVDEEDLLTGTGSRSPSFGSMGQTTSEGLSPSFGSWVASTPSKGGGQLRL
jgi:hypothetical protein